MDTLYGPCASSQKSNSTNFEGSCFFPLKAEKDAHESLDLLHMYHRISAIYTPDNVMALMAGEFQKKD